MEEMNYKEIKELILNEFNEYQYAKYSPLGATSAIMYDYNDYFKDDSNEYYNYIKSLYLINCKSDNLEWYKESNPNFLEEKVIPHLIRTIHFETAKYEMRQLIDLVNDFLKKNSSEIKEINNLVIKVDQIEELNQLQNKNRFKIRDLITKMQALKQESNYFKNYTSREDAHKLLSNIKIVNKPTDEGDKLEIKGKLVDK